MTIHLVNEPFESEPMDYGKVSSTEGVLVIDYGGLFMRGHLLAERNVSLKTIRSFYEKGKGKEVRANSPVGYFVFRPAFFFLTWLALKMGASANQVTWSAIVIGFVGGLLVAFGNYALMIVGALALNLWVLLEYVDGSVARYTDSCSKYGGFIDDLNYVIMSSTLFLYVGAAIYRSASPLFSSLHISSATLGIDKAVFLFMGGWTSLFFFLLPVFMGRKFVDLYRDSEHNTKALRERVSPGWLWTIRAIFMDIVGLVMPLLLLAVIFNLLEAFLSFYAVISTTGFLFGIIRVLKLLGKEQEP